MIDEPMVLTVDQVALRLQITAGQVIGLVRRRALTVRRIAGQMRFLESDIQALVDSSARPCRAKLVISPGSDEKPEDQIGSSTGTLPSPDGLDAVRRVQRTIARHEQNLADSSPKQRNAKNIRTEKKRNPKNVLEFPRQSSE